jgi:hypothetical protein
MRERENHLNDGYDKESNEEGRPKESGREEERAEVGRKNRYKKNGRKKDGRKEGNEEGDEVALTKRAGRSACPCFQAGISHGSQKEKLRQKGGK